MSLLGSVEWPVGSRTISNSAKRTASFAPARSTSGPLQGKLDDLLRHRHGVGDPVPHRGRGVRDRDSASGRGCEARLVRVLWNCCALGMFTVW